MRLAPSLERKIDRERTTSSLKERKDFSQSKECKARQDTVLTDRRPKQK